MTRQRLWLWGSVSQLRELDDLVEEVLPATAKKLLVYTCADDESAAHLLEIAAGLGIEGERLHMGHARQMPAHRAHWYPQERALVLATYAGGQRFTRWDVIALTGIRNPAHLLKSMVLLGQIERHGSGRSTRYAIPPAGDGPPPERSRA